MIWNLLLPELWAIVGEYLFCEVEPLSSSLRLRLLSARFYTITYEGNRSVIYPGCKMN